MVQRSEKSEGMTDMKQKRLEETDKRETVLAVERESKGSTNERGDDKLRTDHIWPDLQQDVNPIIQILWPTQTRKVNIR